MAVGCNGCKRRGTGYCKPEKCKRKKAYNEHQKKVMRARYAKQRSNKIIDQACEKVDEWLVVNYTMDEVEETIEVIESDSIGAQNVNTCAYSDPTQRCGRPRLSEEEKERRKQERKEAAERALRENAIAKRAASPSADKYVGAVEEGGKRGASKLTPGFARQTLSQVFMLKQIAQGADRNNVESLRECYYKYLTFCAEHDIKIGNRAAYTAMGLSKQNVDAILSGELYRRDPRYIELMKEVRNDCALVREATGDAGEGNPIWNIFSAKAFDGVREDAPTEKEIDISPDDVEAASLAKRFKEIYDQSKT